MHILEDLIIKGGWVMYPILLASVAALAIILERSLALRRRKVLPGPFLRTVDGLLEKSQYEEAAFLSRSAKNPAGRLVLEALKLARSPRHIFKERLEEQGRREARDLNARLGLLSMISQVAPLLGLLGTVSGMIKAFGVIAREGLASPGLLAGGISEALLTTAAGLCVAIPSLVAARLLASKADRLSEDLENLGTLLMENLGVPERADGP